MTEPFLDGLENHSVHIIREAIALLPQAVLLWSIGKDSNTLIRLFHKAFLGRIPCPVVHLDTGLEFPEVYAFRDAMAAQWNLPLRIEPCPGEEVTDPTLPPGARTAARKTLGLRQLIQREGYRAVFSGIRRDEQATRGKERIFSPRQANGAWLYERQPLEIWDLFQTDLPPGAHMRVHPLLEWTELDIWQYTRREAIPIVPLYLARDGRRYRSLGERTITTPVESEANSVDAIIAELEGTRTAERSGRTMDHEREDAFERLRRDGYL